MPQCALKLEVVRRNHHATDAIPFGHEALRRAGCIRAKQKGPVRKGARTRRRCRDPRVSASRMKN